jgi:hypothetical protein
VIKKTAKALLAVLVLATVVIPEPACAARMSNITATVYYTPVESYYTRNDLITVRAWPDVRTVGPKVRVGPLPAAFVRHTKGEGTGKITSGKYAGKFLNWSYEGLGPNANQQEACYVRRRYVAWFKAGYAVQASYLWQRRR